MNSLIGAGAVPPSSSDVSALARTVRAKKNFRTDGVPRTLPSTHQLEGDPVIVVLHHIQKQRRGGIHVVQDHIDVAIVEKVPERSTSCGDHRGQAAPCRGRNLLKLNPLEIAK